MTYAASELHLLTTAYFALVYLLPLRPTMLSIFRAVVCLESD